MPPMQIGLSRTRPHRSRDGASICSPCCSCSRKAGLSPVPAVSFLPSRQGSTTGRTCPSPRRTALPHRSALRGEFAIAWMGLGHGIGPGHRDWPEQSRAMAFGGSQKGFRPGLPHRRAMAGKRGHRARHDRPVQDDPGRRRHGSAAGAAGRAKRSIARVAQYAGRSRACRVAAVPAACLSRAATAPPTGPPFDQHDHVRRA